MSDSAVKRPPILSGVCFYLGSLAAIIAVRALTLVSTWNADDRASDFSSALRSLRDAGMTQDGAETLLRTLLAIVAVLASCGVVFAIYTARGHQASRVGMTISIGVSGLMAFGGVLGGSFLFAMVGALAVVFTIRLWTGEIRTYFRTLAGHVPPAPAVAPPADPFASTPTSTPAPAQQAWPSQPAEGHPAQSHPVQTQVHPSVEQPPGGRAPTTLPKPVSIAVWTTFVGSAIVAVLSAIGLLGLGLIGDDYEQMMRDSPLSDRLLDQSNLDYDQLYRYSMTILGIVLPLSLGGIAAASLVLATKRKGEVFLFVMAAVTVVTSIIFVPIGLPWTAAAIVVLVQLRKPEARAWFVKT